MDLTKGAHIQQTRTIAHKTVPASQQKFVAVFPETDQEERKKESESPDVKELADRRPTADAAFQVRRACT